MKQQTHHTDTWKIVAIILIVICSLETLFILWGVSLVAQDTIKENECAYDICGLDEITFDAPAEFDGYAYDVDSQTCFCYNGDEIMLQKYIGG